jgi:hypothetical protein
MNETIKTVLTENNVRSYQITDKVIALGPKGSPRFDTAIWPGYNVTITMQIEDDNKAAEIIRQLKDINADSGINDDELVTVCSWEIGSFFYD